MNAMNGQRNHVMNDDILGLILKRLDTKDLLCLQRVSQQFDYCVKEVLQKKKEVSIGFNDLKTNSELRGFKHNFEVKDWKRIDITPALLYNGFDLTLDGNRTLRRESIVRKFRAVKTLYLVSTEISFKTLEFIVNQWPQLEKLSVYNINIDDMNDKTITEWTQLLSKVKCITIGNIATKYVPFLTNIIQELSTLQSLSLWPKAVNQKITLSLLTTCLPANIQCLYIDVPLMDSQAMDVITRECPQLRKLSVYRNGEQSTPEEMIVWNQVFAMICDRLKCLTFLGISLGDISAKNLAKSIAKLKDITKLHIKAFGLSDEEFPLTCFDTQSMAKYIPPIVSLRSLSLQELKCSPNQWTNLAEMLPNVRKMTLNFMEWFGFNAANGFLDCDQSFNQCMHCVSQLPQLQDLSVSTYFEDNFSEETLNLFACVDRLSIGSTLEEDFIEDKIAFLSQTLTNRRRVFRINLLPKAKRQLIQRMEEMNVSMPECVIVGHVFSMKINE